MNVKVGDRVRFTAKDWYRPELQEISGKVVVVSRIYKTQSNALSIDFNGNRVKYYVALSTLSPINIKGKQLTFSFMD